MSRNSIYSLSKTDANNILSATGVLSANTQNPATMDDTDRANMAWIAELVAELTGTTVPGTMNVAGGTADALTVTPNASYGSPANGRLFKFRASATNTGAATLDDGTGGKKIRIYAPGSSTDIDITAGMITEDAVYEVLYLESLDAASGGWLLLNPTRSSSAMVFAVVYSGALDSYLPLSGFIFGGIGTALSSDATVYVPSPGNGTLKNLYLKGVAPGGSETATVTVRKNSSDTSLTATLTGSGTTGSDTSNIVTVAAGDLLCYKITKSGGCATDRLGVTVVFTQT